MSLGLSKEAEALLAQLERLRAALGRTSLTPGKPQPRASPPPRSGLAKGLGFAGLGLGLGMLGFGIDAGTAALAIPGALLAALSGLFVADGVADLVRASLPAGVAPRDATRPLIGMGATVAQGARIEAGATVEMGATVRTGADVTRCSG